MQTRRRSRRGGGKIWEMARGLRSRLPSFSLKRRHPVTADTEEKPKSYRSPVHVFEHDNEKSRSLPPLYNQTVFYYTGKDLRVFDGAERLAYNLVKDHYFERVRGVDRKVLISMEYNGKIYTFYIDKQGYFFYQKEEEEIVDKNVNYRIIDLNDMIPVVHHTTNLDENDTERNHSQKDIARSIYLHHGTKHSDITYSK